MAESWQKRLRKKKVLYKLRKLKEMAKGKDISKTMTLTAADARMLAILVKHYQACKLRKRSDARPEKMKISQKGNYDRYNQSSAQHGGHFFGIP